MIESDSDVERRLPAEFGAALRRAEELNLASVVAAIADVAKGNARNFLVYSARYDGNSVSAVGALYVRDLVGQDPPWGSATGLAPDNLKWGALSDALRRPCPTCNTSGYLFCKEWSDNKFDPDWHSDLYVLCLACPSLTLLARDSGWHTPASSGRT